MLDKDLDMHRSNQNNPERLWIFGYGSLIWNPGFKYEQQRIGFVSNFKRRFWQGNTSHRGTVSKPGRVATLVPSTGSRTYGKAFEVVGSSNVREALRHLLGREVNNGYSVSFCRFQIIEDSKSSRLNNSGKTASQNVNMSRSNLNGMASRSNLNGAPRSNFACFSRNRIDSDGDESGSESDVTDSESYSSASDSDSECDDLLVLVYIATTDNPLYLGGTAGLRQEAEDIVMCRGAAGHNLEYVLRVGEFLRHYHLEETYMRELEAAIYSIIDADMTRACLCKEGGTWCYCTNSTTRSARKTDGRKLTGNKYTGVWKHLR